MIKVEHVKKSFKEKEVLKDITFEFLPDRVYVIIAPNGTGKTTFINTLCGFMLPDEGTISFSDGMDEQGFDVILSGERNLYVKNTVYENLIYFSMLKGMSKSTADAAIAREKEKFPIYEMVKNKLVETLSYGRRTDWILITESWLRIPYAVSVMAEASLSLRMISHLHRMSQIRLFS